VEASNILFVLLLNRLFSSTEKQNRQRAHQAHLLETPLFDYSEAAKAVISILADVVLTLRLLQLPFLQVQGFCTLRLLQLPLLQVVCELEKKKWVPSFFSRTFRSDF